VIRLLRLAHLPRFVWLVEFHDRELHEKGDRTFVEVRRRTKVIGRFPGETSALSLIWAVLELSSRGWRGVVMTPKTVAEIERLRRQQHGSTGNDHSADTEEVVAA
jgi:putative transposase